MTVFDFDKTLTKRDSTFSSMVFGLPMGKKLWAATLFLFLVILVKTGFMSILDLKQRMYAFVYKGKSSQELQALWQAYAESFQDFNELYSQVNWALNEPPKAIVSAQLSPILRCIFPSHIGILGSELEETNPGFWQLSKHCYGKEKVTQWEAFGYGNIDDFYSDSMSDSPLAERATKAYWVLDGKVQNWPAGGR